MLVLTRRKDEVFLIGDDVEVIVIDVFKDGKVKLGINAPDDVSVDRLEVRLAKNSGDSSRSGVRSQPRGFKFSPNGAPLVWVDGERSYSGQQVKELLAENERLRKLAESPPSSPKET